MTDKNLLAQLEKLPADKRAALLKKLKAKKQAQQQQSPTPKEAPITRVSRDSNRFPMSFAQQRLWFLDRLDSSTAFYNLAAYIELDGQLNIQALEQALDSLIKRHETLRTTFAEENGQGLQIIHPHISVQLPQADISHQVDQKTALVQLSKADAQHIFDLENGPLIKTTLVKLAAEKHQLLLTMHHIIADGWSAQVFASELSQFYAANVNQQVSPLAALDVQYIDYTLWQQQQLTEAVLQQQFEFWQNHLANSPNLELPYDYARPSVQSYQGKTVELQLSQEQTQRLNTIAQQQQTTLFVVMLSAYYLLLHKLSQSYDLVLGTPVANRTRTETEAMIGFFVNTLCLRAKLTPEMTLSDVIQQVKQTSVAAQNHQDLPFERLVEQLNVVRDPALSPLFQTFFSLDKGATEQALQLPGVTATFKSADIDAAKFDFSLIATETSNGIRCLFEYNIDLFAEQSVQHYSQLFSALIEQLITEKLESTAVKQLHSAAPQQQQALLNQQPDNNACAEVTLCLQEKIEQQVSASPNAIACIDQQQQLTYQALNQQANQLAHYLRQQGIAPGDKIGVCLPANTQALTAILAIIKAGAAYVPMDTHYPPQRLQHISDNAGLQWVVGYQQQQNLFPEVAHYLALDGEAVWQDQSSDNPSLLNTPDDPLYVIYTSGSTGLPKGAAVRHRNSINLLDWYCQQYQLSGDDKTLIISALGFDLSQKNLFALLCCGGSVVFPQLEVYDPRLIQEQIKQHQITLINCAPSAFYPLQEDQASWPQLSSLRCVLFGGEPIQLPALKHWLEHSQCQLINMYGPTECTDIATAYQMQASDLQGNGLAIGQAIQQVELYVLDEQQQLLCPGIVGELYIGGRGVGLGYINNPEQNARAFIPHPFKPGSDAKLYRTGDLVRYNPQQQLEFISRLDAQVKIRGFRIELGEIEALLKQQSGINDAVVAAKADQHGNDVLVAYLQIPQALGKLDSDVKQQLEQALAQNLPSYMVPQAYRLIEQIPLSANGKIDRNKLAAPQADDFNRHEYIAPANAEEEQLVRIWEEVLQRQPIGTQDNFFEIGGHSLLATQLSSRIAEHFTLELPVKTIFEVPNIAGQANLIRSLTAPVDHDTQADDDDFEEGVL